MPYITILGTPTKTEQAKLAALTELIQQSVARVPVLRIPDVFVSVFYQPDLQENGQGEELCARIDGLYQRPERTDEVLRNLAEAVCKCLWQFAKGELPQCTSVEAFVSPMIPMEHCAIMDFKCPKCMGRGAWNPDAPCDRCKGTGRVI